MPNFKAKTFAGIVGGAAAEEQSRRIGPQRCPRRHTQHEQSTSLTLQRAEQPNTTSQRHGLRAWKPAYRTRASGTSDRSTAEVPRRAYTRCNKNRVASLYGRRSDPNPHCVAGAERARGKPDNHSDDGRRNREGYIPSTGHLVLLVVTIRGLFPTVTGAAAGLLPIEHPTCQARTYPGHPRFAVRVFRVGGA